MPNYRRARVAGGTYFFTVVTHRRAKIFKSPKARAIFRSALNDCRGREPFTINAIVLLPEHLHTIWTLPAGDTNYPERWRRIKREFTRAWLRTAGSESAVSPGRTRERRRGVWQPRFWEHTIQSDDDFERHFDYIHYNPVRHGLVNSPADWQWSSFHRWVRADVYDAGWGRSTDRSPMDFTDIANTVGE